MNARDEAMTPRAHRAMVPVLDIPLPRPVTSLHQIEITSRCNLRCPYCPSHRMTTHQPGFREPGDMSAATFSRCLDWVEHFTSAGTQHQLNLAGIGESTMHPQFVEFLAEARRRVGPDVPLVLATNGVGYDENLVEAMTPYRPDVWVSMHRPEKGGPAAEWYRKRGLLGGVSTDPSVNANDWAGQVRWFHSNKNVLACMWMRVGMVMAASDGRLLACCLDATGAGTVGHVRDEIGSVATRPWSACRDCHQEIAVQGYGQRADADPGRLRQIGIRR